MFHSSSKGRFWSNQVNSRKKFKLRRSKVWILKKPFWWRLEESVTLCKILECSSFSDELMLKNHAHLHKLFIQKLFQKHFKNPMFSVFIFWQLNRAVDRFLSENYWQGFTETWVSFGVGSLLIVQEDHRKLIHYVSIMLSTTLLDCRQACSAMAKILAVVHWIVDSRIGLSTTPVYHLGQIWNTMIFSLFKLFCLIPKWVYFTLLVFYWLV